MRRQECGEGTLNEVLLSRCAVAAGKCDRADAGISRECAIHKRHAVRGVSAARI